VAFVAAAPAAEAVAGRAAAGKAAKAAGGKAAARRAPAGGLSKLERDRAAIQAIKDARPAEQPPATDTTAPAPTPPGAGAAVSRVFSDIQPSGAGGGLVLGALAYVLGLTYLRSGRAGVKALLRAKFLNKVD
jgi:hypothetical protein